jgi:hypothetical protein
MGSEQFVTGMNSSTGYPFAGTHFSTRDRNVVRTWTAYGIHNLCIPCGVLDLMEDLGPGVELDVGKHYRTRGGFVVRIDSGGQPHSAPLRYRRRGALLVQCQPDTHSLARGQLSTTAWGIRALLRPTRALTIFSRGPGGVVEITDLRWLEKKKTRSSSCGVRWWCTLPD